MKESVNQPIPLADVELCINVRTVWGGQDFTASVAELDDYNADPDAWAAKRFGLTVEQYRAWIKHEGNALCGSRTKAGKPCSQILPGGGQLGPKDWLDRHRQDCCYAHGGGE